MAPIVSKGTLPDPVAFPTQGYRKSKRLPKAATFGSYGRGGPEDAVFLTARKVQSGLNKLLAALDESAYRGKVAIGEIRRSLQQTIKKTGDAIVKGMCGLDLQRFLRGTSPPRLTHALPMLFVLAIISMLYTAFVLLYMPAAGIALNSPTSMMFHAFIFLVLASYHRAVNTDPGTVPDTGLWHRFGRPPAQLRERKRLTDEARWCRKSASYKPDRAHYDRVTERIVLRMDHHCVWIGNTVGFHNHKFFLLFLTYVNGACGMLGWNIFQLLVHATLPALSTFLLIGAEGLTVLLLSILGPFLLFHCWLLFRNMTTVEFCEKMGGSQPAEKKCPSDQENLAGSTSASSSDAASYPYDLGLYRNICSVMGDNPLVWLLPVRGPSGDGLSFQRIGDNGAEASECGVVPADLAVTDPGWELVTKHRGSVSEAEDTDVVDNDVEEDGDVAAEENAGSGRDSLLVQASGLVDDLREGFQYIGEVLCDVPFRFSACCGPVHERQQKAAARRSFSLQAESIVAAKGSSTEDCASECGSTVAASTVSAPISSAGTWRTSTSSVAGSLAGPFAQGYRGSSGSVTEVSSDC